MRAFGTPSMLPEKHRRVVGRPSPDALRYIFNTQPGREGRRTPARQATCARLLQSAFEKLRGRAAVAGGSLVLAGECALRWSVFRAGFQSARDPRYVVAPQRERKAARG